MSLTSYRTAPPRVEGLGLARGPRLFRRGFGFADDGLLA